MYNALSVQLMGGSDDMKSSSCCFCCCYFRMTSFYSHDKEETAPRIFIFVPLDKVMQFHCMFFIREKIFVNETELEAQTKGKLIMIDLKPNYYMSCFVLATTYEVKNDFYI